MSSYRVGYTSNALRELSKLPRDVQPRVHAATGRLGATPRPPGSKKLAGGDGLWRIRVGEYRVIYLIDDRIRVVTITRTAHRRDVYRA